MKMGIVAVINIILLIGFIVAVNAKNTSSISDECKNVLDTHRYGYTKYYHVVDSGAQHTNYTFIMRFMVRARSNAHILLSPTPDPSARDPVYEIVLGAGQNSFSDIRRAQRNESRQTVRTANVLSSIELKTFWIAMSKGGILGIGNWGDDQPFLFWQDTDPLLIRYFSFCTWNGVWGRWYFNCLNNNRTGYESEEQIEEVSRHLTTHEKLRRDLLTSYDPYALPVMDADRRTTVKLNLECQYVTLNEKRSILTAHGTMTMNWIDEKVRWRPSDYGNTTSLNMIHNEIWQPEIVIYNAANSGRAKAGYAGMTVTSEGVVMWRTPTQMETWCDLNLNKWPHDQQVCDIQLGVWSQPRQLIELVLVENNTTLNKQRTGSEWEVTELLSSTTWARTPWTDLEPDSGAQMPFSALTLRVTLQRSSTAYHSILRLPLIVISVSSLLAFWMNPLKSGKIVILCLDMVLMSIFFLAVGTILPAQSDKTPRIVLLYCISMTGVASAIIFSVFLTALSRYTHNRAPPHVLYRMLCEKPANIMLCLPQTGMSYKELGEQQTRQKSESDKLQQHWILFCTALDRVAFFSYTVFWGIICAMYE